VALEKKLYEETGKKSPFKLGWPRLPALVRDFGREKVSGEELFRQRESVALHMACHTCHVKHVSQYLITMELLTFLGNTI
jgi:hypothetical protein